MPSRQGSAWTAAILVALLAVPPVHAAAPDDTEPPLNGTTMEGRIFQEDGSTAAASAVLRMHHLDTDAVYTSEPADARGRYSLSGLPYGYADIIVTTAEGDYVGNQVVNLPPGGKVKVSLVLKPQGESPAEWWSGQQGAGGTGEQPQGVAMLKVGKRGAEFWTSKKGITTITTASAVFLIAVSSGGGSNSSSVVSPTTP